MPHLARPGKARRVRQALDSPLMPLTAAGIGLTAFASLRGYACLLTIGGAYLAVFVALVARPNAPDAEPGEDRKP